jgi:trk system potassium uptake protein TrkH
MRPQIVLRYIAFVFLLNAAFLLISAVISGLNSDEAFFPLFYSFLITGLFAVFPLIFVPPARDISNKEGLIIVIASWFLSCLIGVMPYILWGEEFTFTNAWFESVSGYTTTGSSILTNIEVLPLGLLFWRSATHWIGGIGIIIFVLAVLSPMGVSRIILYRTEMSHQALYNFRLRAGRAVQILLYVYVGLTVIETLALLLCGMNLFDAVTHSFATIATGGFSPKNANIAYYQNLSVEIVVMIFMVLSGIHFGLLFSVISGKIQDLWKSVVVRYYLIALGIGVIITTIVVHGRHFWGWAEALRYASFQIISIGTSTGFATADSSVWPALAQLLLLFFTLQCACAGSTSGGIKVDRIVVFAKSILRNIKQIQHPKAVFAIKLGDEKVDDSTAHFTNLYIPLYIGVVFVSALLLTALGVDALSAFSGSAATMGGVGPGLGTVGSMSNFAHIPSLGKWVLTATMLLGRLEIYGLIIFFMAETWRK